MSALFTLFEQFVRGRRYLKNVTPKAIWQRGSRYRPNAPRRASCERCQTTS